VRQASIFKFARIITGAEGLQSVGIVRDRVAWIQEADERREIEAGEVCLWGAESPLGWLPSEEVLLTGAPLR